MAGAVQDTEDLRVRRVQKWAEEAEAARQEFAALGLKLAALTQQENDLLVELLNVAVAMNETKVRIDQLLARIHAEVGMI